MSKGMDQKKEGKKKPAKSLEDKRAVSCIDPEGSLVPQFDRRLERTAVLVAERTQRTRVKAEVQSGLNRQLDPAHREGTQQVAMREERDPARHGLRLRQNLIGARADLLG